MVSRPFLGLLGPRIREQMLTEGEVSKARVLFTGGAPETPSVHLSLFQEPLGVQF